MDAQYVFSGKNKSKKKGSVKMYFKKDYESLKKNYQEALQDPRLKKLIQRFDLTDEEAMKKTTKLKDILTELDHCQKCKGLYECQNAYRGHVSMLEKKEGETYFTYVPCKYKKKEAELKSKKMSEEKINERARMKDIDVKDKNRANVIRWLDHFYEEFDFSKKMKGLYLHGNFGCGKTFLISALLHELEEKKNASVEIIYFPEILRTLKSDWELYDMRIKRYQTIDILCIDDIGAEKVSEWGRDEVLGTILQSRMNANLTTFFTSNLTLNELESHFLLNDSSEEKIKSRRIMERIKQLTIDMELISENKRN